MDPDDVFAASTFRRRAFADLVDSLDEQQLSTESLCRGWDVRTVAAHLAAAVAPSKAGFVLSLVRAGGRTHRANDLLARTTARRPVAEIVALLRDNAGSRFSPPVVGPRGPLTDVLVHTGDVAVPLNLPYDPDTPHVRFALDFVTQGRPVGFVDRGTLTGLHLVADDLDWSWGQGRTVTGRGIDLLMGVCGRPEVAARLSGPGQGALMDRLRAQP